MRDARKMFMGTERRNTHEKKIVIKKMMIKKQIGDPEKKKKQCK